MIGWVEQRLRESTTLRNVLETYSVQVIRVVASLVTNVLLARLLTPGDRGTYAVALAVALLASQFGAMGINTANVYFAARQPEIRGRLLANSVLITAVVGPFLMLIVFGIRTLLPDAVPVDGVTLLLVFLYIPAGVGYLLFQGLLLGGHRIRAYNTIDLIGRLVPVAALSGFALSDYSSPTAALATALAAQAIGCGAAWWELARTETDTSVSVAHVRESFQYGIRTYLTAVLIYFVMRVDLLMLSDLRGSTEAGYYSLAASVAESLTWPAMAVGTILLPKLSALVDVEEKFRVMLRWLGSIALLMVPVTGLLVLGAKFGISLLFGTDYLPAYDAFLWLAPGVYFLGLHNIAVAFITSIGYRMSVAAVWTAGAALNLAGNLYAIPRYGMVGAAILSSICYAAIFAGVLAIAAYNRRDVGARTVELVAVSR
jgi:O-antigen/teichoic acid export membrane protein